jgi:hypothetical protein
MIRHTEYLVIIIIQWLSSPCRALASSYEVP